MELVLVCDLYFGASRTVLVIFASGSGCHYEIDVVGYTAVCQQWYESASFWYIGAWIVIMLHRRLGVYVVHM